MITPQKLSAMDVAFPANVMKLMPPMSEIPKEYSCGEGTKWHRLQSDWFYFGVRRFEVKVKEGIDKLDALNHLSAIQSSFEPKHEHKVAAVAYLASLWFEDATWERAKR